jgi:multidrug efflux pump subunit AcrA (membrane-fusion protein)
MPVVAAIGVAGWWVLRPDDGGAGTATTGATATERVVEATVGTMSRTVSADGTVAAVDTQDLSFTSAGTVTAVNVEAGDTVEAGQVLATLDAPELRAAVTEAEASVAEAEARLADDTDAGASDEQIAADESSVTAAQDQLSAAQEALAGTNLVADFDGTVASVDLTEGEQLGDGGTSGTSSTGSGSGSGNSSGNLGSGDASPFPNVGGGASDTGSGTTAQIQLTTAGKFSVELGFDATEIDQLKVGQQATVTVSTSTSGRGFAFPGGGAFPLAAGSNGPALQTDPSGDATTGDRDSTGGGSGGTGGTGGSGGSGVQGYVSEVGTMADASSGVASYPVTVVFADASGAYNVGANVTVDIAYEEVADAIQVPSLVVSTATDGTATVEVKTGAGTETRTVTTGLTSGGMTQITSGLQAGESVVISFPGPTVGGGATSGAGGGFAPPAGGAFTPPEGGGQFVAPGGGS